MFTVLHDEREYTINHIQSAKINSAISDIPELSLKVIDKANNPGYPYITGDATLLVNGYEWRVKSLTARTHYKNIKATHIAFDLVDMPFNQSLTGSYTPAQLFGIVLAGTDFSIQLDANGIGVINVENFGRTSVWEAFKQAIKAFGLEFKFLPGRVIQLGKELSIDNNKQFRYAYNIKSLAEKTDSTDVVTHVIVNYSEEYAQTATFVSPAAANYERPVYKIINDSRIESVEAAEKRAKEEFKDLELAYEIDCTQTSEVYELGEIVHTIYEPLNDLSITTRILKTTYEWDGSSNEFILTSVTVGNHTFKNEGDIIQDLIESSKNDSDKNLAEARKSINLQFRETDQKIVDQYTTITAEYSSAISISARELRSDYNAKFTTVNNNMVTMEQELSSSITQTAKQIRSEVSASVTSINGDITDVKKDLSSVTQTASSIQSTVASQQVTINSHGTQISSAQSSITQMAGQILQKVSKDDFTGNTIVSMIEQTAEEIKISASKIRLDGSTIVNGSLKGTGSIEVSTDATIGNSLNLGPNSTSQKQIIFNNQNRISSDIHGMSISAIDLTLGSRTNFNGYVDFSSAYSVDGVVRSATSGLEITRHSSNNQKLAVKVNGIWIGDLQFV